MLWLALRTLQNWLCRVSMPRTWDYGPAQLAIYADLLAKGSPLYRDFRIAPFIPLVYGPVVPAITAKLAPMFGSGTMAALEAGRSLTIASTIVTCAMIFFLARRTGVRRIAALLASLAFLLSPMVLRWGFEYRIDMPVLACELSGIFAFAGGVTTVAVALFVVSFFIKPTCIVGLATVMLFCGLSGQRRRAVTIGLIWFAMVATVTAVLAAVYPSYLLNTFATALTPELDLEAPLLFFAVAIGGSVGVTILAIVARMRRRMSDRLTLCLLIVASLYSFGSSLRWGSNAYYFLPAMAALTIVAGAGIELALEWILSMPTIAQLAAGAALSLLLALGWLLAPSEITMGMRELFSPSLRCPSVVANTWDPRALRILASIRGPIVTDAADLTLLDARPNLQWNELMIMASMQAAGTFNDSALLAAITHRQIAAFAFDDSGLDRAYRGRPFFWPRLRHAIESNYRLVAGAGPPFLMVPKDRPLPTDTEKSP
jgi:hypothetical protein